MLFLMLIPALIFFVINNYIPMVGIYYAFTRFNFRGGLFGSPFIGFENFNFLMRSGKLLSLTVNTIGYNIAFILVSNILQIFFAIVLSQLWGVLFRRISQSLIFLPYFVSYVILNAIVYSIFNYDTGYINTLLTSLGIERFNAYGTAWIWRILMVVFFVWKSLGYGTVVYLAAITGISQEYYEAAKIDGAGVIQQIFKITIPLLAPTFIILLLFALGGIMRGHFDLFYQVIGNNGLLFEATDILDTYVYRSLKQNFDVGMGTAAGLYQSIVGFVVIMTTNRIIKKTQPDYVLF
jgi:putative aldouronate transport system permease protein